MIIHIIKRDGRKVPFNVEKIANAIFKAAQSCGGSDFNEAMDIAVSVCNYYEKNYGSKIPTVEEVQDLVEKILIENGHAKTAKAYIHYRYERTRSREMKTNLMCVLNELTFSPAKDSDIKRENANIDGDTAMGTMLPRYLEVYVFAMVVETIFIFRCPAKAAVLLNLFIPVLLGKSILDICN